MAERFVAKIIKKDHDRLFIVDFLIANMFKAYLLLYDKNWQDAFIVIY